MTEHYTWGKIVRYFLAAVCFAVAIPFAKLGTWALPDRSSR